MTYPIEYPAAYLPSPASAPLQWAERRGLSTTPGPRQSRILYTDQHGTQSLEFILRSAAQVQRWVDWVRDDLVDGAAWFAASWAQPQGGVGVRRFIGTPSFPEYLPVINAWRVSAVCEVRGRGDLPMTPHPSPIIVDVDAVLNGGNYIVGAAATGFDVSDELTLTLPPGQTFTGWSAWNSDSATGPGTPPPPGQYWGNGFIVTGMNGSSPGSAWTFGSTDGYPNGEAARAAFGSGMVTGYTAYRFWISDANPGDNRGGVSIQIFY